MNLLSSMNSLITTGRRVYSSSTAPMVWNVTGTVAITTSQYKMGTASLQLAGTSNSYSLMTLFPGSSKLTGSWTIEFWVYIPTGYASGSNGACLSIGTSATIYIFFQCTSVNTRFDTFAGTTNASWNIFNQINFTYSTNTWYHIAIQRNSSTNQYTVYYNGNLASTNTNATNIGSSFDQFSFGSYFYSNVSNWGGYGLCVDGLRISNIVRYSSSFTPPTSYTVDGNTIYINYFEGTNGSTTMTTSQYYSG